MSEYTIEELRNLAEEAYRNGDEESESFYLMAIRNRTK